MCMDHLVILHSICLILWILHLKFVFSWLCGYKEKFVQIPHNAFCTIKVIQISEDANNECIRSEMQVLLNHAICHKHGLEVIKLEYSLRLKIKRNDWLLADTLEYSLRLKIKRNDWLLADTCPQAANHCALF